MRRSCGVVTLRFVGRGLHDPHGAARRARRARRRRWRRRARRRRRRARARAPSRAEGLRRLDRPQPRAVERARTTVPSSPASLTVSVTRAAAIAQSASLERGDAAREQLGRRRAAARRRAPRPRPAPGAAASAARTDSERVAPPRTPMHAGGASRPAGSATTTCRDPAPRAARRATSRASAGRRARRTPSGPEAPRRSPLPAATRSATAPTHRASVVGAAGHGSCALVAVPPRRRAARDRRRMSSR